MIRLFFLILLLAMTACGQQRGSDMAKIFSGKVRQADSRLAEIAGELKGLPQLNNDDQGSRYGFRSVSLPNQTEPHWVQIDLEKNFVIDSFVAMPVHIPSIAIGHGFPLRFKIEVADNPEMKDATLAVDHSAADVANPGLYPMLIPAGKTRGRYVRFTSTKHFPTEDGFIWALEELMVIAGNSSVAVGKPKQSSSSDELYPHWSIHRINDGMSQLGMPVSLDSSPTKGYLSSPSKIAKVEKWIAIDLQADYEIDEVRLVPVQGDTTEIVGGRGYPRRLALELCDMPEFIDGVTRIQGIGEASLGYPFGSAAVIPCAGKPARHIRVITRELFARGAQHSFALAEIQVYSKGRNVALGKPVRISDKVNRPPKSGWAPEFVVDGYSSRKKLIELPDFIDRIVRRSELEGEKQKLSFQRETKVRQINASVITVGGTVGGAGIFGWIWMLLRQKAVRRRDAILLREQIARDLHDDIGSNLGGILLQCQLGAGNEGLPEEVRDEFNEIRETVEQTSDSMRDIVWLIDVQSSDLRELVIKMRDCAERLLGDLSVDFVVNPEAFRNRPLTLLFRRHVLLAFKETLNNLRKHAEASKVTIRIDITQASFSYQVSDDGCGFDPANTANLGHGLNNLHRRATRLKGTCTVESTPGKGTVIGFTSSFSA